MQLKTPRVVPVLSSNEYSAGDNPTEPYYINANPIMLLQQSPICLDQLMGSQNSVHSGRMCNNTACFGEGTLLIQDEEMTHAQSKERDSMFTEQFSSVYA